MAPITDDTPDGGGSTGGAGTIKSQAFPCLGAMQVNIRTTLVTGASLVTGILAEASHDGGLTFVTDATCMLYIYATGAGTNGDKRTCAIVPGDGNAATGSSFPQTHVRLSVAVSGTASCTFEGHSIYGETPTGARAY